MTPASFLDDLAAATRAAEAAEAAYRREAAAHVAALELERAFAFRRLNWMQAVADKVAGAQDEDSAVAHTRAALRSRLGWSDDNAAHEEVLERFSAVARAMYASLTPAEPREDTLDIAHTLSEFEAWFARSNGRSFWALFERYIPETPLVDF